MPLHIANDIGIGYICMGKYMRVLLKWHETMHKTRLLRIDIDKSENVKYNYFAVKHICFTAATPGGNGREDPIFAGLVPLLPKPAKGGIMNKMGAIPKWIKDAKYHFCAVCGRTDDLQYHHWEPENGHNTVPENIIVLCAKHHQEWHGQSGRIKHNVLVKEGIARAKARGVKVGRKPTARAEDVIKFISENSTQFNDIYDPNYKIMTEHEIMASLGVSTTCYSKYKRELMKAISEETWPYSWPKPKQFRNHPLYDHVIKKMRGDKSV